MQQKIKAGAGAGQSVQPGQGQHLQVPGDGAEQGGPVMKLSQGVSSQEIIVGAQAQAQLET